MKTLERGLTQSSGVIAMSVKHTANPTGPETVQVMLFRSLTSGADFSQTKVATSPPAWFARAARRLSECGRLSANWDGEGAEAPNSTALSNAGRALEILQRLANLEVVDVVPSVESGVGFVFANGNVEFSNDGDVTAVVRLRSGQHHAWDVGKDDVGMEEMNLLLAFDRIRAEA